MVQKAVARAAGASLTLVHAHPSAIEKNSVHHPFEVRGESHTHVDEMRFEEAGEQTQQEEEHAMPHETTRSVFH
jgi:hypothetical protein